ncbi:MAG: class F420-dependent oxidoreductase [Acidimicrobiales bacterium]|nr:class F420-dependent oxidoreductase [Acidimicrobiales bacterium]
MGIGDERYVSLTTYRRSGEAVSTPVWIVALADGRVGFTTTADAGKVKRLRNDPTVVLRPCDLRGNVVEGALELHGTGIVLTEGADDAAIRAGVVAKYGIQARALRVGGWIRDLVLRRQGTATVLITLRD